MSREDDSPLLFRRVPAGLARERLKKFARRLQAQVAGGRRFTCLVTNDRELRRLNREFLGIDRATDVLSFPIPGGDELGDIAVSIQSAGRQAREHGHSREREIMILMLHGLLHLLGMDHESDRGRMRRAEARWRQRLELPLGLTERSGP